MKLSPNIDREFYATFARNCRTRYGRVGTMVLDRAAGRVSDEEAREKVGGELHDFASEAALMSLPLISRPATRLAHALRGAAELPPDFWDRLEEWTQQLSDAAQGAVDGSDPTSMLVTLDIELAERLK